MMFSLSNLGWDDYQSLIAIFMEKVLLLPTLVTIFAHRPQIAPPFA